MADSFDWSCPDCGAEKQRPNFKCCEEADRKAGKVMDDKKASNDQPFDQAWTVVKSSDYDEQDQAYQDLLIENEALQKRIYGLEKLVSELNTTINQHKEAYE